MSSLVSLFQQNRHWPLVQTVVLTLNKAGHQAFLAGGCVRDALLGHIPKDFDIATSARPDKIIQLFPKSRQQGKAFGVVVVFDQKGREVEVATFRKDGPYRDGRHPDYVTFLSDKEDALRRDFTINALFYNISLREENPPKLKPFKKNIIDYVGGLADIQNKIIRAVGDPETRFQEDHLRILRALRFSLKLGFPIEQKTEQCLFKMKHKLMNISKERVYEESFKIMQTGKWAIALPVFHKIGLLKEFTGDLTEHIDWPAHYHFYREPAPLQLMQNPTFLWAMAFFPLFIKAVEPTRWARSLKKWTFPVTVIKELKDIMQFSRFILNQEPCSLGKKLRILNSPLSPLVLFMCKRYLKSQNQTVEGITALEQKFKIRAINGQLPKALINGHDLKALGFKEDKTMAHTLEQLYDLQLEQNIKDKIFLKGTALKMFV